MDIKKGFIKNCGMRDMPVAYRYGTITIILGHAGGMSKLSYVVVGVSAV